MPVYDYSCKQCNHQFEALVRGKEQPACPACGGRELERLLSLPTVQSDSTRAKALKAAKKRDAAQAQDRVQDQLRYEQSHDRHG
jgi:putative FmdB family regulatory protein